MSSNSGLSSGSSVRYQGAVTGSDSKGSKIFWPLAVVLLVSLLAVGWFFQVGTQPAKEGTGPDPTPAAPR